MDSYTEEYYKNLRKKHGQATSLGEILSDLDPLQLIELYETIPSKICNPHIRTEYSDEIDNYHLFVPSGGIPALEQYLTEQACHYYWRGEWLRKFQGYPQKISLDDGLLEEQHSFDRPYADLVVLEQKICQELIKRYPLSHKSERKFKNWKELWFFYELQDFHIAINSLFIPISKTETLKRSRKHLKALKEIVLEPESTIKEPFGQSDRPFSYEVHTLMANLAEKNTDFDNRFFQHWLKLKKIIERQAKENPNVQISYLDKNLALQHTGKSKQISEGRKKQEKEKKRKRKKKAKKLGFSS